MRIGDILGDRFEIEKELSGTGDEVVYRARDLMLERQVGIKRVATDDEAVLRTTQVHRVFEVVKDGAELYAVMELPRPRHKAKRSQRKPFLLGLGLGGLAIVFVGVRLYENRAAHRLAPTNIAIGVDVAEAPVASTPIASAPSAAASTVKTPKSGSYATYGYFAGITTNIAQNQATDWFRDHEGDIDACIRSSRCSREGTLWLGWEGKALHVEVPPGTCEETRFERCIGGVLSRSAGSWPKVTCESDATLCNSVIRVVMK